MRRLLQCVSFVMLIAGASASPAASLPARAPDQLIAAYRNLASVGLDTRQTFSVEDALIDEEDIHLSLDDGTIAFTQAVDGEVTGAFFQGDGEILLLPPDQAERASVSLFTGQAILEERFSTAYFRFNDDLRARLAPYLRPVSNSAFIDKWSPLAKSLSESDALRLLTAMANHGAGAGDRVFHALLGGVHWGDFDVLLDTGRFEQVSVAQAGYAEDGTEFYDVWAAFPMRSARGEDAAIWSPAYDISDYKIGAHILPNRELEATAELSVQSQKPEQVLVFELSRFLKVSSVTLNGAPLQFIQNEAIHGSDLARRGNDLMAVVLPAPLAQGQTLKLKFAYSGSVISDAGNGLMYVGARGIWYPNRGPAMSNFDLEFRSPAQWTLVATGKRISEQTQNGEQASHWVSERPIPLAGFNLGQYVSVQQAAGAVEVATYAARTVEPSLAARAAPPPVITSEPGAPPRILSPLVVAPAAPALPPKVDLKGVEAHAVQTVNFYSQKLGPYPYSALSLTQIPGPSSQGWPGLIFLSSRAFLESGAAAAKTADYTSVLYGELMPAHEIAHQWWGDSVLWATYRDQWLIEALANYCALLQIESESPEKFRMIMQHYREELIAPGPHGLPYSEAGAVTLGVRLSSAKFPDGYERIAYERGSWLMHMLREMLAGDGDGSSGAKFMQLLAQIHHDYEGRSITTREFQQELEKYLPADVRYERKASLDWFFDGWINGSAIPRIEAKDVRFAHHGKELVATGTLVQEEASNDLVTLVPIYAASGAAARPAFAARIFADGDETSFRIVVPERTRKLLVDPYSTILRR